MEGGPTPEQCRVARAVLGWTQAQLAEAADLSERTVREFEKKGVGSRKTLRLIRQTFGLAGVAFVNEDGREGVSWPSRS